MKPSTEEAIDKLLCYGTVEEVQTKPPRVKVRAGGILTNWLRWFSCFSGECIDWASPSVGEEGMILSPNGDMLNGAFLRGMSNDDNPTPSSDANTKMVKFKNGDIIKHDGNDYIVTIKGNIELSGKTITMCGDTHVTGKLSVDGDVVSAGKMSDSDGNNGA